jgi:parallel beta-helix repeat protein
MSSGLVRIEGFRTMIKKWQLVLAILIVASLSINTVEIDTSLAQDTNKAVTMLDHPKTSYEPHSPIIINSNLDFESQGWPGNGTPSNPFAIEGLSIVTDGEVCINISNTDVFFVIKDCLISSNSPWDGKSNRGITLGSVTQGRIENVTITKKWLALVADSSSNCSITECQVSSNCHAIVINGVHDGEYPEHWTIFNNTLFDNHIGVSLYHVRHCIVDCNDILGDVHLQETVECTVSNNRIEGSQTGDWYYYLSFSETVNTIVINNTMIDSGLAFVFLQKPNLQLHNNTVNGKPIGYFTNITDSILNPNEYGQLLLVHCSNVTVRAGTINNTAEGVSLYYCSDCIIDNCTIYDSGFGATLLWSDNCSVISSDFHDNKHWGVAVVESTNNIVVANTIYENRGQGIFVPISVFGFNNTFFHNVICSNGDGSTLSDGNAWDDSHYNQNNAWDDGVGLGNFWDDYGGTGEYHIPGEAGSVDRYPARVEPVGESELWIGFKTTPSEPEQNETVAVSVGVIDRDGVDEVILSYSKGGNLTWTNLSMSHYGPVWNATIPAHNEITTVTYRVFVLDRIGNIESSVIQSYTISGPNTTDTPNGGSMSITIAIAIGSTLTIVGLALILSRRR